MTMAEAVQLMNEVSNGYMVTFEWRDSGILRSDTFPDEHAGEPLIPTEEEAWDLARRFAQSTRGRCVNIYVVGSDFKPVANYKERTLYPYP